jgi:hypothetical protein
MKRRLLTSLYLIATIAIIGMSWSCTKENASAPSAQQAVSPDEDALLAGETITANIVPGIYTILRFIDTGDDITAKYDGYTFEFKADGTLVATKGADTFTGTWKLNSAQTRMTINIHGTAALNNLSDDSWKVAKITNQRIVIKKAGPDKVVFVMQ